MIGLPIRTVIIVMLLAAAGCEIAVGPRAFPEQTFRHLPPISLNVAKIDIVLLFEPPLKAPHVEHEMPVPPHKAIERWVVDRIRTVGISGQAVLTVRDASVVEKRLKPLGGIRGTFTKEQAERYDARVEVEISAIDGRGLRSAKAMTTSSRSRTVPEDATLRQRQVLWYELTERVMQDFDRTLKQISSI